ncbi:hypothetical protein L1275_000932 [Flavobacterium sp. HSC-61S13]|nr:hypothetical protein [Flavobacterium sp. HSC-61S13]
MHFFTFSKNLNWKDNKKYINFAFYISITILNQQS